MHGVGGQNVQQLAKAYRELLIRHVVDGQLNIKETNHGYEVVDSFFGKSRARLNHFNCAGFNLGVVDCVNDGDFNRLGVFGQLQRVVGNIDKFPVENAEIFHAVSRKVVEKFIYQKFLRRRVGDRPERLIKALIQFKNVVAEFIF